MNRIVRTFIAASLVAVGATVSAAPISVLGLTLGGPIKPSARPCIPANGGTEGKLLCWVDRPDVRSDGSKVGMLHVPGSDTRPKWAAHVTFDAQVSRAGTLDILKIRTFGAKDGQDILASISSRFGTPFEHLPETQQFTRAKWRSPDAFIDMICKSSEGCMVEFRSAEEHTRLERELTARKAKDSARPIAP